MLFHSQIFILGFLPPVLALYYALAGWQRAREGLLIAASLAFYAWWDLRFLPLLAGLAVATWGIGRLYLRYPWVALPLLGMALNLGALGWFKYADFIGSNITWLVGAGWTPLALTLPLGISFFVFQKISYLIDLRRGDRHVYGFVDFCLFVSFFPQLIAGPLVRHNEIIPQLRADPRRPGMWERLSRGLVLFLIGMAKKLWIADTLAPGVDQVFAGAASAVPNAAQAWAGAWGYALQIYFDFSGYSDMAIGLALMFGLVLPQNFDAPYRAGSIRDFWRRWHMTLSRFLRDYLYVPLGGNRRGAARQAANLVVTMLLGGLWHGANWTFVAWGGLHGMALALHGAWRRTGLRLPWGLGWGLTLAFVVVALVPFRAPDFATAWHMVQGLAGGGGAGAVKFPDGWMLAAGAAMALLGPTSGQVALGRWLRPSPWLAVPVGIAAVALLLLAGGRLQNAFIYFQF
ncbi:MBOAT family protein [Rhodovastum atsumiense]|uniref:Probable alginate O-acetylase AlgI n=1 Tax=Rhodovastum atsumiense TaxID=504468 RepID=A0A5M6IP49_9PROT|nr:MBOAT family protein [Rhodovastum atsumiense]KAA5610040.1 MBOAT family protein [Rhodovastum atsumiense]CAH2602968.1 MBOAT family protein [Rhodovastum atsumiense]